MLATGGANRQQNCPDTCGLDDGEL